MQTLLLPATRAGSFTASPAAVPLSASAIAVPRLPQPFLRPNSLPSHSLKLTRSCSSFGSSIALQPWKKLPFIASASSQVSPAFNDESEKSKLEQVAKRLEKTARYFKRLGGLGFWGQLVCTVVAAVILSFSVVVTGKVTSPATFYATAGGIVAAFISVFWSFGYIRLSEKLGRTANDPTKAPPRADVVKGLKNGIILNLLGMGAAILGMQATVGLLVAKALTTSAIPLYQGISPGNSPVLALDVCLQYKVSLLQMKFLSIFLQGLCSNQILLQRTLFFRIFLGLYSHLSCCDQSHYHLQKQLHFPSLHNVCLETSMMKSHTQ
ncbi:Protein TIC 21, chloroplastic, partial [Mucuna pruriens]